MENNLELAILAGSDHAITEHILNEIIGNVQEHIELNLEKISMFYVLKSIYELKII